MSAQGKERSALVRKTELNDGGRQRDETGIRGREREVS